jgi:hypothetical protein
VAVPADRSELSSISSLLEQLTQRISVMGETAQRDKEDGLASELFAIERALTGAGRRIVRLLGARR